jgi:Uma2 family endonuclease
MAYRSIRGRITEDEYVALEETSEVKHELVGGEIYAMTGASPRHNTIALDIARRLDAAGRPKGCRVFASDVKLRVPSVDYYYPDVMLVCDPAGDDERMVHAPCLVVEITPPSPSPVRTAPSSRST